MLTAEFLNHFPSETDMVINYIYIICTLESDYGIKIPDKVWMKLRTVNEVVDTVYEAATK